MPNDDETKLVVENNHYFVKALHDVPKYTEECCLLINLEWTRSLTARMRSVNCSSEKFPLSLILLQQSKNSTKVVGHCKYSKVPYPDDSVFVESVVIHPDLRGKGLGKFLMLQSEQYVYRKNIKYVYLSTQGQEEFYKKLGYVECPPICIYGSPLSFDTTQPLETIHLSSNTTVAVTETFKVPPPPPPMPVHKEPKNTLVTFTTKTFMKKQLNY